ncbi:zinc finger MYM-type protein 1-like isoform X7 [Brienomyrus brachyistius]|uniref:zinc finger MYM-type protein 1-like isoform X6 n=1 Tax=Brienomyrus brachyistius TaxID=42636 RepID=UPI0020B29DA6|nr:zinc finger MYM-type protein 1-like isoform X6 [Brienomyrus brachyistius]XP_048870699.1 zinc finger MYM-type protein 1-like isoform X7 [Brienomyrus brachyistius]
MREHACYKSAGISVRIATKTLVSGAEMECQQEGEQYPKTKRKRPSGAQYRKRRKEEEERRRREAILKYLESSSTANEVPSTSSSGDAVCSEPLDEMTHRSAASLSADGNMRLTTDSTLPVFSVAAETSSPVLPVEVKTDGPCAAGAADWPSYLGDTVRTVIVGRGPYQWQQEDYSKMKRKKPSGAQYRKRRKEEEERRKREAILKYLVSSSTADEVPSTSSSGALVCSGEQHFSWNILDEASEISSSAFPVEMETDELCPADPADWPSPLTDTVRTELVLRGPYQVPPDFVFPKRDGARSCQHLYFFRTLKNCEKVKRNWLIYSYKNNSLFCFCCKLFSTKTIHLVNGGLTDWKNATTLLNSHDRSPDHLRHLASWKEFELRLKAAEAVDKQEMTVLDDEKRWRAVLARLIAIVQSLAVRNMALRGDMEKLYCPSNGNFLKEVELLAQFDPIMKDHVHRVKSEYSHLSYLGKHIQNELIECIGAKVVATMVQEIKQSKYFSLILGCTPDVNHTEHLSVLIRIVTLGEDPQVKEHFMGFLETDEFTGQSLATLILQRLEDWQISFDDCRGQSYDNGANMRGKRQGVQATLLQKNPRALFVPCGAHTLSLVVADAAKSSNDAMGFFGVLQKLYSLFSASTHRWAILAKHVTITLKMWSETRWENRVEALKPLRYEVSGVREALLEVRSQTKDPVMKVEAQFLAEEVGSFRFLLCTVIWYDILNEIQHVSKVLQSETMQVSVAVNLLNQAEVALQSYRATGFVAAQSSAKDLCEEMNVEEVLTQKGLRSTDRLSSYESPDEPVHDALKNLEVNFFNMVVDSTIAVLKERFQTLGDVENKFGILSNFQSLPHQDLIEQAEVLGHALSCGGQSDLDGRELAQELQDLPDLPSQTFTALELLKFIQAKHFSEIYPNLWVALRIALTLPVTVASVECFSKSKLIKTYLRSTMCQERLSSLAVMSINPEVVGCISCDDVIEDMVGGCQR